MAVYTDFTDDEFDVFMRGYDLGAVLAVVVDLDRPRDGFIQVSQQPLIDVQDRMGPPGS